ncbi:MAG: protease pro-enzyme activation domain-containing protein [Candidatus Korobacteraceae bacterium]|jgi:subtilase family serine protease
MIRRTLATTVLAVVAFAMSFNVASNAEAKRNLITQKVDESKLVTLSGNTRPEANQANDRGAVSGDLAMDHLMLQLRRPTELEASLVKYIDELHNPSSPDFHHWLTAKQVGASYGLAQEDIDVLTSWLKSQGFKVNEVYPTGTVIDFSGTAAKVEAAFHTQIHNLDVNGVHQIADMSDPKIPAALAPAVVGVIKLNSFMPHPMIKRMRPPTNPNVGKRPSSDYTLGGGYYAVVPSDLATIYNLTPAFNAGFTGLGRTIALIEDTDVYNYPGDWNAFRSTFGLSEQFPSATFVQVHPGSGCEDPGINGDDVEAALDVEWSSAAAPNAAIQLASCVDTATNFGGFIALEGLLNETTPPDLVSISYGESEVYDGQAFNQYIEGLYQQAVSQGVSVFVSSGDENAASSDAGGYAAFHGIAVSGWTSTPYNVSVGGTDYGDTYLNENSAYWSSTNNQYYGSALSYIPEIPWNDECASVLLSQYYTGSPITYGSGGFCTTSFADFYPGFWYYVEVVGGSGGPSNCATGVPSIPGVASGTCAGFPKPSWQTVLGNPSDGVRDIPDVSLFAANGAWGHYYIFCYSDPNGGGVPCTGSPANWPGAGGTSFSSPIMAGIQLLVNQATNSTWGNPNTVYYQLANTEYGTGGNASCNSTLGNGTSSSCIFYDETLGDMDTDCLPLNGTPYNCYMGNGNLGVLSTSNSSYQPAYGTTTGWDFATGIGTVNAYNLVTNWPTSDHRAGK